MGTGMGMMGLPGPEPRPWEKGEGVGTQVGLTDWQPPFPHRMSRGKA